MAVVFNLLIEHSYDFPSLQGDSVFYPIAVLTQIPSVNLILPLIVAIVIIIILGLAKSRGTNWIIIIITFIVSTTFIAQSGIQVFLSSDITHYNSISFNDKTYHLIRLSGGERWGYSSRIEAYTIVECDQSGLFCSYFSTPYLKDYFEEEFELDGQLILVDGQQIGLSVGNMIYSVDDDIVKNHD